MARILIVEDEKNTCKDKVQVECETICSDEDESIASAMERGTRTYEYS